MAVSGGARPSIQMEIVDGVLVSKSAGMTQSPVRDIDLAIHRLLAGESVYVQAYMPVVDGIRKTIEAVLKGAQTDGK